MRDVCFLNSYSAEIHVARRVTGEALWSARAGAWNVELWAGRTYVCASFRKQSVERRVKRAGLASLLLCFWMLPSPLQTISAEADTGLEPCPKHAELVVNREYSPRK